MRQTLHRKASWEHTFAPDAKGRPCNYTVLVDGGRWEDSEGRYGGGAAAWAVVASSSLNPWLLVRAGGMSLDSECTAFQAELYALDEGIRQMYAWLA